MVPAFRSGGEETRPAAAAYPAYAGERRHLDQDLGGELATLHVRKEVGAARDQHRPRPELGHEFAGRARVGGPLVAEPGEPKHGYRDPVRPNAASSSGPTRRSSLAGGSTRIGSGQGTAGKPFGPTRPAAIALRTFSGVTGVSSI